MRTLNLITLIFFITLSSNISAQQYFLEAGITNAYRVSELENVYTQLSFTPSLYDNESLGYSAAFSIAMNNNWNFRLKGNADFVELEWELDSRDLKGSLQDEYALTYSRCIQHNNTISPGIFRKFDCGRFAIHGGIEFPVSFIGKIESNMTQYKYDVTSTDPVIEEVVTCELPGGFSVGVGGAAGASYRIINHVWIGAEYSASVQIQNVGGGMTTHISYPVTIGNPNLEEFESYDYRVAKGLTSLFSRFTFQITLTL